MRDRLIELVINADIHDVYECKLCTKDDDACDCCYAEKLADHLLANGVIVSPCKVGDTVYVLTEKRPCYACYCCSDTCHLFCGYKDKDEIVAKKAIISEISFLDGINSIKVEFEGRKDMFIYSLEYTFMHFGKTVFLTKEEAESALKEREGK